ncbi:monovalent cation/H+ antiporter subunit D [Mesobacterium pallidum]|uniref:monovalent cation/H+ antiporter subunit D n=1 Tax=Mesobacterium pallidum TaxID=2872037 RepID=UPI001EE38140
MLHWIIAPVVLPALLAPLLGYVMRHDIVLARIASTAGTVALAAIAFALMFAVADGTTHVYRLGDWPAPFGIVLVLDRLSAMMVLLTAVLALIVLLHAIATGWDARGRHFHALFQFQLMGICGAFLTGDVFNLFVFFEVLLIASYGLMIHGGGRARLRAGLQYVVMNLVGSTLFLFALGTLYASAGTLNMADLALKLSQIPQQDAALVRVAVILLMVVFGLKAALFPVQFWLPGTYASAPAPVAALFAIMTKVGAYAILRVHTLSFGPGIEATGDMTGDLMFPAAIVTVALGAIGVLGARRMMPLIAFSVIGSMGTMMVAVAAFTPEATAAALYYMVHSTFAAAALFLVADLLMAQRADDRLVQLKPVTQNGLLSALFFAAAIGMAGMPPLSGFLGKLWLLDSLRDPAEMPWAWTAILAGSLVTIVGFVRAGSMVFWKSTAWVPAADETVAAETEAQEPAHRADALQLAPSMAAIGIMGVLAILAGPMARYTEGAAQQLYDRAGYVEAVLVTGNEGKDLEAHSDEDTDGYAAEADGHGAEPAAEGEGH